jgi:hypothetical protein
MIYDDGYTGKVDGRAHEEREEDNLYLLSSAAPRKKLNLND